MGINIKLGRDYYSFETGDTLTLSSNHKSFALKRGEEGLGSVSHQVVDSILDDLNKTCPYPLTFVVK